MGEERDKRWAGVAIITGASSGIGEAIARNLAPSAKGLIIAARRDDRIHDLASELGDHVIPVECDVQLQNDVTKLATTAMEQFGAIDAIINNAGIARMASMLRCRVEDWDAIIDTNIKGVLYGIAAVLPQMLKQKTGKHHQHKFRGSEKNFPWGGRVLCIKTCCSRIKRGTWTRSQQFEVEKTVIQSKYQQLLRVL